VKVNYQIGWAAVARLKGNYPVAEVYSRQALALCREGLLKSGDWVFYETGTQFLPDLGEVLLMQGRPVEAELVLRESLKRIGSFADDPDWAYAHPFFWVPFSLVGEGRSG
jgi:CHAT domain-containing protein